MRILGFAFAFLTLTQTASAGILVGNGGDSVVCKETKTGKYPYTGLYVLDYVMNFPHDLQGIVPVESLNKSLNRLEKLLTEKAPEALTSFHSFRAALDPAPFVDTAERAWRPEHRALQNIRDEVVKLLPPNCRLDRSDKSKYGLYQQTVVRKNAGERVKYTYDKNIVENFISRHDATQASILMIHEWLWDFYEGDAYGAPKIRSANLFLHSTEAGSAGRRRGNRRRC